MYMYVSVRPEKIIIRFSSKVLKNSGVGAWVNFIFHFIFYYDSLLILVSLNFYENFISKGLIYKSSAHQVSLLRFSLAALGLFFHIQVALTDRYTSAAPFVTHVRSGNWH